MAWNPIRRSLVSLSAVALLLAPHLRADTKVGNATGVVEGRVTYRSDVTRKWRYARYYIKDAKLGWLAEAVVALESKQLGKRDREQMVTHVVDQKDFQFQPETIAIQAGDTVEFRNSDPQTHNVKSAGLLADFNVNTPRGGKYQHCFEKAGGINRPAKIGCIYHGTMRSWIFVFDHPHFQVTEQDGRFRFKNVPEGVYTLHVRHPAGELRWKHKIEIRAGETKTVDISLSPDDKIGQ